MVVENINAFLSRIFDIFKWWIVIAPWEQAIRVRGGRSIKKLDSGIYFRIPGLDRFFVQSIRRRYLTTPTQAVTTLDGKAITISGGIAYSIKDIGVLYDTLQDPVSVIQTETRAIISNYIAANDFGKCNPKDLQEHVNSSIDFRMYGLDSVEFYITDFVAVRTYRIINSGPLDWNSGELNTTYEIK